MGFIEERIGKKGFDGLAEQLLKGGGWPDEMKPRSLGNALRQLDQGGRQDWIRGADGARLSALAAALKMPETELRDLLDERVGTGGTQLVSLVDLPEARPIDLMREPLFPGIPEEVYQPQTWMKPLWWCARGGSGRTLVGRWLDARGLARFVHAPDGRAALESIRPGLPIYIELDRPDHLDQLARERLPPDVRVCVAAPFPPPDHATKLTEGGQQVRRGRLGGPNSELVEPAETSLATPSWSTISSPPVDAWALWLLSWVERRLDSGTAFKRDEAAAVVKEFSGWLHTPGDVLALCGLIDQWGAEKVSSKDEKALGHAIELAFQRIPESNPFRRTMAEEGLGLAVLLAFVQQAYRPGDPMVVMDDLLERGLDRSAWVQLIPLGLAPPPDLDEVRKFALSALQEGSDISPGELLSRLTPGPATLIAGLQAANLLESQGGERLAFRMRWLLRWVEAHHLSHFSSWTAQEIGDAILHPEAWLVTVKHLLVCILNDDWSPIHRAVSAWTPDEPALVAALEGAFLAAGLALLMDKRAPGDLYTQLWTRQCWSLVARFEDHHRLPALIPVADANWNTHFDRPTWALAAIAISEQVPGSRMTGYDRGIAPWFDDEAREPLRKVIGSIWSFWVERNGSRREDREVLPWAAGAFAMGARLFDRYGPMNKHDNESGPPCLLLLPSLVARHIRGEPAPKIESWDLHAVPFDCLVSEAERQGVGEDTFLTALWTLAGESNHLAQHLDNLLEHNGAQVEHLWRTCPPDVLARRLQQRWNVSSVPWSLLSPEQWVIALEPIRQIGIHGEDADKVWGHLPWSVFEQLTRRSEPWGTMHEASRIMWAREPDKTRSLAREVLPGNPGIAWLLWTMPFGIFMAELSDWLHAEASMSQHVLSRLHGHTSRRAPGWREAWTWMVRLSHPSAVPSAS